MTKFDKAAKTIAMKTVETAEVKYKFELLKTRVHSWAETFFFNTNILVNAFQSVVNFNFVFFTSETTGRLF